MEKETHICCICGKTFKGYGNNPEPLKDSMDPATGSVQVCCDECNLNKVLPARLAIYKSPTQ